MQAGEQVVRNVLVPEARDRGRAVALRLPLRLERRVDHVDRLDQKGAGAGRGIEYLHEVPIRRHALRDGHVLEAIRHLRPGRRISQAVRQPELGAQQGIQRAHDVAHDRTRRVEDAAPHALLGVILLQKQLVEVDYRVFARVAVAEVAHHGFHVGGVDHLDDLGRAEFVEIDPGSVRAADASADLQERVQNVAQKRTGVYVTGEIAGGCASRIGYARREQAVGDGLGVHVGEVINAQIVQQRLPKRLHQLGDRPARRLDGEHGADAVADGAGQRGQPHGQCLRGRDHLSVANREGGTPLLAPGVDVIFVGRPRQPLGQLGGYGVQAQGRVRVLPAQHLERRQVAPVQRGREVRETDLTGVVRSIVGDEQQVVHRPGLALRPVGGCSLSQGYLAQDAPQRRNRQPLRLELDEEDTPRLVRRERPHALDLLDLGGVLGVDPQFFGGIVERPLLEVIALDRPVHPVAQKGDQLVEASDARQLGPVSIRGHRARASFSSIQHLSEGCTPTGASMRLR